MYPCWHIKIPHCFELLCSNLLCEYTLTVYPLPCLVFPVLSFHYSVGLGRLCSRTVGRTANRVLVTLFPTFWSFLLSPHHASPFSLSSPLNTILLPGLLFFSEICLCGFSMPALSLYLGKLSLPVLNFPHPKDYDLFTSVPHLPPDLLSPQHCSRICWAFNQQFFKSAHQWTKPVAFKQLIETTPTRLGMDSCEPGIKSHRAHCLFSWRSCSGARLRNPPVLSWPWPPLLSGMLGWGPEGWRPLPPKPEGIGPLIGTDFQGWQARGTGLLPLYLGSHQRPPVKLWNSPIIITINWTLRVSNPGTFLGTWQTPGCTCSC